MELHVGHARQLDLTFQTIWCERDVRIFSGFQHIFVHSAVTRAAAALAAGGVHHYFAAGLTTLVIEYDPASPKLERSVHGVEYISQSPVHLGGLGIEVQLVFGSSRAYSHRERGQHELLHNRSQ